MPPSNPPRQNVLPAEQNVRRQRAAGQSHVRSGETGGVLSDREIEQMLTPEEVNLRRSSTFPNQTGNLRNEVPHRPINENAPNPDPNHGAAPSSSDPPGNPNLFTDDELNRMERLIALREREAKIPPIPGHRFGVLKLSQNARAVRGTVRAGENIRVRVQFPQRQNIYGDAIVRDEGALIEGELEIDNIDDYFGGRMDVNREDDGADGDAASSTDSGASTESYGTADDDDDDDAEVRPTSDTRDTRDTRNASAPAPAPAHAPRP